MSALLALTVGLSSTVALADDSGPAPTETPATAALDHPASVLDGYARGAHDSRITSAWMSIGGGALLTTSGLVTAYTGERESYGHFVWIVGALSLASGVADLFLPSDLEQLEHESGGHTPGYTSGALDVAWQAKMEHARTLRNVSGIVDLTLGAGGITAGALIAGGAGNLSGKNRTAWSIATFATGGFLSLIGVAKLVLPSRLEKGYRAAFPGPSLDVAVAPVSGGGTLQVFGSF